MSDVGRTELAARSAPLVFTSDIRHPTSDIGMTLLELMAAITISGLVALAVLAAARIGMRAWEKGQAAVLQLRRVTNAQDIVQFQLADYLLRNVKVELSNRRMQMPFFFAEEERLLFLTSYSALQRGRGGIVAADYFAERHDDQTCDLWLDEKPAGDDAALAAAVADIAGDGRNTRAVLRAFDKSNALLLWKGLRECSFRYLTFSLKPGEKEPSPEWRPSWSLLGENKMPLAVALEVSADRATWKGLAPVSVYARLAIEGAQR